MKKIFCVIIAAFFSLMLSLTFSSCNKPNSYKVNILAAGNTIEYRSGERPYYSILRGEEELAHIFLDGEADEDGIAVSEANALSFNMVIPMKYSTNELKIICNGEKLNFEIFKDKFAFTEQVLVIGQKPTTDMHILIEGLTGDIRELTCEIPVNSETPIYLKRNKDYVEVKSESLGLLTDAGYDIYLEENNARIKILFGNKFEFFVKIEDSDKINYENDGELSEIYDVTELDETEQKQLEETGYAMREEIGGVFCRIYQIVFLDTKIVITP